ncbi:MAG: DnaJ domain-containing protein [Deltaproteobacteria bacterium]|nr:DnaJ domain-containing protein [Deltaproteobacteria bacterium]MBW2049627.1 DnaJ domain-containing protein [Deltaproteobacteria bacterium]MBW2110217.1 DnaJ domain-containing protein [Deltaproteobacteria bacterium]MBW2352947.1 DnaJ domain-containing protein [Deltaproteobacteria bacterium]HDZ90692.1 DUF1232 domain-containing protein [Deltaproteobacteria bacterium]
MKILLSLLGLSYLLCPYDLMPDFFVGVGWIDDLIALGFVWWYIYVYRRRRYSYEGRDPNNHGASQEADHERSEGSPPEQNDPYSVLGIGRDATPGEIKQAYLRLAGKYHPDKVVHLGEEFRELAEIRFKEIQGAYQKLKSK